MIEDGSGVEERFRAFIKLELDTLNLGKKFDPVPNADTVDVFQSRQVKLQQL